MSTPRARQLWRQQVERFHRLRSKKAGSCFCARLPAGTPPGAVEPARGSLAVTFADDVQEDDFSKSVTPDLPAKDNSLRWHLPTPQEQTPANSTAPTPRSEFHDPNVQFTSEQSTESRESTYTTADLDLIAYSDQFKLNFRRFRPHPINTGSLTSPSGFQASSRSSGRLSVRSDRSSDPPPSTKHSLPSLTAYSDDYSLSSRPLLSVQSAISLVDCRNSIYFCDTAMFCGIRMQRIHNALVRIQWGDAQFYSGDLQRTWLSVDTEDLKFYRYPMNVKFLEDLRGVMIVSVLSSILFPLRCLISVFQWIFYTYVIHHTSPTDMVHDTAHRMRSVIFKTTVLISGCLLSWWYILCMLGIPVFSSPEYAKTLRDAINPTSGFLSFSELYAPVEATCMVLVLTVVRKQRRDMRYLIDIIRPRILLHEAGRTVDTKVFLGPVWQCRRCNPPHGDSTLWLLRTCNRSGKTKLQTHSERIWNLLEQVEEGTGIVSDLNEKAQGMHVFHNFDLHGLLQNRIRRIRVLDNQMNDPKTWRTVAHQNTVTCRINISELIEMLCAGYDHHFDQNDTETILKGDHHSFTTMFLAGACALYPTVHFLIKGWHEGLRCRLFMGDCDHHLKQLVGCMAILGMLANFTTFSTVITRLLTIGSALRKEYECLLILQRMVSTYHASYHGQLREDFQRELSPDDNKPRGVEALGIGNSESLPRDVRKAYWFHSSLTRGADCHVHIKHVHGFDKIMMNRYGVVPEGQCQEHCHSFVELDLQDKDQLQLWWAVRKFIEAGLLDRKLEAELTLSTTLIFFLLQLISHGFWSFEWGLSFTVTIRMGLIKCVAFGFVMNKVMRTCARINTILKGDGDRLTFIQHDLVYKMTQIESHGDRQKLGNLAKMSLAKDWLGAVRDNIDRDHNPMQIFGLPITFKGITRCYFLLVGSIITLAIKLFLRVSEI